MTDQKKTKAQLIEELRQLRAGLSDARESENSPFRTVFETTTEGILLADIATQSFVDANPAICRMLGYTHEQLVGMSVKDIHPPESLNQVLDDFVAQAQGKKDVARELPCLKSDGTIFYADIRVGKTLVDGRPCSVGFFSDVTGLRQACYLAGLQRDLAVNLNSANNLDAALKQCLDTAIAASGMDSGGIYLIDAHTGAMELQCHSGLSHRFVSTCAHYDAEAPNTRLVMSGTPVYQTHVQLVRTLGLEERHDGLRAIAVVPVLHKGKAVACINIASHTNDGIPLDARHTLEGIAATIGSTVSRLRAEQALAATEARYHEVFSTVQEGIGIVDDNEIILIANPAYARIFDEESTDAVIGRSLLEFLPDNQREIVLQQTEYRRSNKSSQYELKIVTRKGNSKSLLVSVTPRLSDDGRYTGAVGAVLDITERKHGEEALQEKERELATLIGNLPGFVYRCANDPDWTMEFISEGCKNVTGYAPEDFLYNKVLAFNDIIREDYREPLWRKWQELLKKRITFEEEYPVIRADGETRWVWERGRGIFSKAGELLFLEGFITDVSDRRRMEQALREREAFNRAVIENSPIGISIRDARGKLLSVNDAWMTIWGVTAEEVENYKATDNRGLVGTSRRRQLGQWLPQVERIYREGGILHIPELYYTDDPPARPRWVALTYYSVANEQGAVDRVVILTEDITERKESERALRESEHRNTALIAAIPDMMFLLKADGTLLDFKGAKGDLGMSAHSWLGRNFDDAPMPPEVKAKIRQSIEMTLASNSLQTFEHDFVTPRGVSSVEARFAKCGDDTVLCIVRNVTKRKRAEEALRKSEKKYRSYVDNSPYGIFVLEGSGHVLEVNPTGEKMSGYTREEILARNINDFFPQHWQEEGWKRFATLQESGRFLGEVLILRKDAAEVWWETSLVRLDEDRFLGFTVDIMERKQTEERLRLLSTRQKDLLASIPDIILEVDCNKVYTWANKEGYAFFGDDVIGKEARHYFEGVQTTYQVVDPLFDGDDDVIYVESWQRRRDGEKRLLAWWCKARKNAEGQVTGAVSTARDITEGKQVEEALRDREARLSSIMSAAPIGIGLTVNRIIVHANRTLCDMLGYSSKELITQSARIVYPTDEDYECVERETYAQIREYGTGSVETRWCCKDGRIIDVLLSSTPLDREDLTRGVTFTALDITERKQAEQNLRQAEEKYRTLVNNVPVGVYRSTPDGQVLSANPTLLRIFGYDSEEAYCSRSAWDSYVDRHRRVEFLEELSKHGSVTGFESQMLRSNKEVIWVSANATAHRNESGEIEYIDGTEEDITELRLAQQALAESEERYRQIVEASPFGMHLYRLEPNGRLIFEGGNPAADWILRTDHSRLTGKTIEEAFPSLVGTEVPEQYRKIALYGERWRTEHIEYEQGQIKGAFEVVAFQRSPMKMVAVFKDITEHKRAEEAQRIAEEQYRQLFEGADEGIIVIQDGKIVLCNPAWTVLSGFSQDESCRELVDGIVHSEDREFVLDRYRRRVAGEDVPTGYDLRIVSKSGEIKTVRITSSVISWNGRPATLNFISDVTARRQAEDEIRKFKTISDNASYGTHIISLDGTLVYMNRAGAEMHGCTPEELIGRHLSVCHSEQQLASVQAGVQEAIRAGSFTSNEVWHVRRDGTEFPTLMSGTVIKDAEGQPQYLAASTVDITELKRLQEFADRARRLEAAGQIAGQVAHDFNNLLGPLVAYPDIIRDELGGDHPVNAYLEPIEAAARQMAEINQQLLTLGRRGHYVQEPLNLNEIIRQTLRQIESECSKVVVAVNLAPDILNVNGGIAQLSRVMTNLYTNAIDAMQGIGTLTISTTNWYADGVQGKYGQIARGEYIKAIISDTGCGIPEDILPLIFEPFFTTKKADRKRGSGLGLSVVHAVVEDHKGYIDIESSVGQGTSVYVYLPITRQEVCYQDEKDVRGGDESILVVDDDAIQREVSLKLLQKLGYCAEAVGSGEAALDRLQHESFDLLILDMVMPEGLDGGDTFLRTRELYPDQRAIMVSGYAESDRVAEAQHMGAGEFVRKPLTSQVLAAAVRRELDRAQVGVTVG